MEEWRDIKGYEEWYQVSNRGRVKSLNRTVKYNGASSGGSIHTYPSIMLKQCLNTVGYLQVSLSKNNVRKRFMVHRLVADSFCEHQEGRDFVNHIDGNYLNNDSENLEWVTNLENCRHAIITGLHEVYGECSHLSKFTNRQAEIIRRIKRNGISTKELSELLNVSKCCINRIYKGETYNNKNKLISYKQ